jgi:hypothetical protein
MSATYTWPLQAPTVARTATASSPSGSKGLSPKNTPNGPQATEITSLIRTLAS